MTAGRTSHYQLIGRRELGAVTAEDYIDWAVAELVDGQDSPSLRILAGLASTESLWIVEDYFSRATRELHAPEVGKEEAVYRYADLMAERLIRKEGDARECVRHIYRACVKLGYPKIMSGWIYLDDAIDAVTGGYEPYYPRRLTKENFPAIAAEEAQKYLDERRKA